MRLTTKGRFAVTAMIDVAMHGTKRPVTLAAVSERQRISLSYLEQLFGKLRHGWLKVCADLAAGTRLPGQRTRFPLPMSSLPWTNPSTRRNAAVARIVATIVAA